ncbi:MAG: MFS transporter [Candidatus Heimdallarchaeota archaeon]
MTDVPTSPEQNNSNGTSSLGRKRNLPILVVSASLIGAAGTILYALMQPLVLRLGGSMAIVGVVISLSSLSTMLPMFIFGEYSDTVGRRRPMIVASLLLLVAGLLFWTASYWLILIPAVLMVGFAFALNYPASSAATSESVPGNRRGRAFAYRSAGRLLAGVVATLLGIVTVRRGDLQSAFFLSIVFVLINLGFIYFLLSETLVSPRQASPVRLFQKLRQNLKIHPKLKALYIYIAILDPLAFDTGWVLMPALLTNFQGVRPDQILLYTMIQSLIAGLLQLISVAGRLADRSRKWGMVLADSIAVPSILAVALFPSESIFLVSYMMLGFANGFFGPAITAYVVDHVPQERVAAELGKFWSSRGLAGMFPPILGSFLAATYGFSAPLFVNVAVGVFSVAFLVWKLQG